MLLDLINGLLGDSLSSPSSFVQDLLYISRPGCNLSLMFSERSEGLIYPLGEKLLAFHTANAGLAALLGDLRGSFQVEEVV